LLVLLARGIERGIPARTGRKLGFFALHHHVLLVMITVYATLCRYAQFFREEFAALQ
jgi:hypothetical protein